MKKAMPIGFLGALILTMIVQNASVSGEQGQASAVQGVPSYSWYNPMRYVPRWQTAKPNISSALLAVYSQPETKNVGYHSFAPWLVTTTQYAMRSKQDPRTRASSAWYFAPAAAALVAGTVLGTSLRRDTVGRHLYSMMHKLIYVILKIFLIILRKDTFLIC